MRMVNVASWPSVAKRTGRKKHTEGIGSEDPDSELLLVNQQ